MPPPRQLLRLSSPRLLLTNTTPHIRHQQTRISHGPPTLQFTTTTHPARPSQPSASSSSSSSIDPTELSHFNALASSWWDPHGPSRLLHLMNPLRHSFIRSCLASSSTAPPSHPLHYLDVGCGGGIFAESAARLPNTGSVTGVDPSADVLAVAEAHKRRDPALMEAGRLQYKCMGIEELDARALEERAEQAGGRASVVGAGYDIVTLFEVLEHVANPSAFLDALAAHVRPGGWLVLSTIARTWTSWVTTKVVAEDLLRIVPRGTHDWEKYVNEEEVRGWFEKKGGWESARAMGVVYVPGVGWKEVQGGEKWGNYFFGVRKMDTR